MGATTYQQSQLESLWVQAGGSPSAAPMASAIALAESRGNPGAQSSTGDVGLWQINAAAHPGQATTDPLANAQAAVAISANGTNWRPWCTAYSDAACGTKGGTFLGAGSPFLRYLTGSVGTTPATASGPPASDTGPTPAAVTNAPADNSVLFRIPVPIPGIPDITIYRSQGRALAGGTAIVAGGLVLIAGLIVLATGSTEKIALKTLRGTLQGSTSPPKPASDYLTEEDREQRRQYDDELAERRRTKLANREGLVRPVA